MNTPKNCLVTPPKNVKHPQVRTTEKKHPNFSKDFAHLDRPGSAPLDESPGFPSPAVGLSSAKAARGVAEDVLTRGVEAEDLDTATGHGN